LHWTSCPWSSSCPHRLPIIVRWALIQSGSVFCFWWWSKQVISPHQWRVDILPSRDKPPRNHPASYVSRRGAVHWLANCDPYSGYDVSRIGTVASTRLAWNLESFWVNLSHCNAKNPRAPIGVAGFLRRRLILKRNNWRFWGSYLTCVRALMAKPSRAFDCQRNELQILF